MEYLVLMHRTSQLVLVQSMLLFGSAAHAQNLVPNPGFEEYTKRPSGFSQSSLDWRSVKGWRSPTQGTSDHFCRNAASWTSGVPRNAVGIQEPVSGAAYCGILQTKAGWREYLQCILTEPLMGDSIYTLDLWVALAEASTHSFTGRMGLLLLGEDEELPYKTRLSARCIGLPPQVILEGVIPEDHGWVHLSGTYRARGGERKLILGFFCGRSSRMQRLSTKPRLPKQKGAYYLVDDVSVVLRHASR